jgi:type II secretory pathway component GspD/PulD (secretin)
MNLIIRASVLLVLALLPASLLAQPPGGRGGPPDSTQVRSTPQGYTFNYENQTLSTIINALIEAGGLNASVTNIPNRSASLKIATPVPKEMVAPLLVQFADQNGIRVLGDSSGKVYMRLEGPAPAAPGPSPQQLAQQQLLAQQLVLRVLPLKHSSAVQLAPVLQNLFTGTTTGGALGLPGGGVGNFQVLPAGGGGRGGAGGAAQGVTGGRGGRGGDDNDNNSGGGADLNTVAVDLSALDSATLRAALAAKAQQQGGGVQVVRTVLDVPVQGGQGGRGGQGRGGAGDAVQQILGGLGLAQALQGGGVAALSQGSAFIRVVAEPTTNSLLIRATDADFQLIQTVINGIDLRPRQVLIEVTIVEVTRTHDLNVGISGTAKNTPKSPNGTTATGTLPSSATARDFVATLVGGRGNIDFNVAINALTSRGDVRVSALPVIIAQNNLQAQLNVGSRRPFVQVSQSVPNDPTGRVETIQYLDVGTVLTITPTINPDGYVNMAVTQTDNSATNEVAFSAPVLSTREATTQVFVRDGQTTVIGGLAGTTKNRTRSGIPLLSDIPWIGAIFRSTHETTEQTELFLFLTPHVVYDDSDTDALTRAIRDSSAMLRSMNIGPKIIVPTDTIPRSPIPPGLGRPPIPDTTAAAGIANLLRQIMSDTAATNAARGLFPGRGAILNRGGAAGDTTGARGGRGGQRGRGAVVVPPPDTTAAGRARADSIARARGGRGTPPDTTAR